MSKPTPITAMQVDSKRYATQVRDELVAAVCARLPLIVATEMVISNVLIYAIVAASVSFAGLLGWLGAHFVIAVMHCFIHERFRRHAFAMEHFDRLLVFSMLLLGVYWGALLSFTFGMTSDYTLHIYLCLIAQLFGVLAISVLSERLTAYCSFTIPASVALAIVAVTHNDLRYAMMAASSLLCTAGLVLFARAKYRNQIESLTLRFALLESAHELSEQRDAAQRANIAKSKFLAAASHDLRQPLHALTLLTGALDGRITDADARSIVKDIQGSVSSLEKLFGALLDISRLDAGVLQPRPIHFELSALLQRICSEYAVEAERKGLQLICEAGSFVVHSDPLLLERILRNFLANAVRYTQQGEIRVRCLRDDEKLRVEVIDTGIGIPQSQRQAIFDEFFQLDNPERDRDKGLGLGLAIVRRIAELLDYPVGIESTQTQGSCFFVAVPTGDSKQVIPEREMPSPTSNLQGLRVVVIDDDAGIRESTRKLLTTWGCDSIVAENENEAATTARARFERIDAIVADYRLRDHRTGLQAVARLCEEFGATVPSLLVSGDTAPERLREVAASGHTLVHKPVQPAVLKVFLASAQRAKDAAAPVC